jgi:putative cell wall-binding protein
MTFKSITRLGGNNRYETSVMVANRFFKNSPAVTLAYGRDYPDGLCGGPLAMIYNCPLLLIANNGYARAKNYAKTIGATSAVIYGGTALISNSTVDNVLS